MTISPLACKPAPKEMLIDAARLEREYFERRPDRDCSSPSMDIRITRICRTTTPSAR